MLVSPRFHKNCCAFGFYARQQDTEAVDAAAAMLEQRSKNSDWRLTEEEERAVTDRLCGVADNLTELRFMLATAVER